MANGKREQTDERWLKLPGLGHNEIERSIRPSAPAQKRSLNPSYRTADINADMGMVSIHAQTIVPATPHRTAVSRFVAPTPTMAPVIVWVVLTGIPATDAPIMEMAAAVSAQNPPMG